MKIIFTNFKYLTAITSLLFFKTALAADTGAVTPQGSGGGLSYTLQNPLAFDTLQEFIVAILHVIVIIATPIVVVFIVLAGFNYVAAQGNPAKIQAANKALTYAIIGGVLILGAEAISVIISNLVTSFAK